MFDLKNILWFYLTAVLAQMANATNCPIDCKCGWVLDSFEVNCARSGLVDYPKLDQIPVEHLDLSSNNFVSFPKHYADIQSLIYLDLSNNQIEYLEADALLGFSALRTLLLANNSITSWASLSPDEAFQNAISLKRLILSGNRLGSFITENPKLMLRSESLVDLELERCGITHAGGDQLINGLPNLQYLSLSHNALEALNAIPSRSLRILHLSDCKLPFFGNYMLSGLPSIELLNLSWNAGLEFGKKEDIIVSHTLTELDVSYCNLDNINLMGLPSLQTLNLHSNMLRELTPETLANNTQLETVDLSGNAIRVIAVEAFVQLRKLIKLDLSFNEIANMERTVFRANDALTILNLSRNFLEKFTKFISNSLREINLSWCGIIAIESTSLSGLPSLQILDLSNNLIKEFPAGMRSPTLQELNLSNDKLNALGNNTFRGFPELATLRLNGNRFTNTFSVELFRGNKFLDRIWMSDNPWICNCYDRNFQDLFEYLTARPQKLKDRSFLRCASPGSLYGQTWESACRAVWIHTQSTSSAEKAWTTILVIILLSGGFLLAITCFRKYMRKSRERQNRREYRQNQEEMHEIRRQNQRILQQDSLPNAPTTFDTNLPSYDDAIRMPKLAKSMVDLTATARARKKFERSQTDPEHTAEHENGLMLDNHSRFRSEEMLSNRDKERTARIIPYRRTGFIEHNNSGSRRFSIEDDRFVASAFKAQNLQSAEKIANFQSYENSPYTKRRPKIAEIPPFKRATLIADSVEFLTDPEFETVNSKPGSPFARRKPKTPSPISTSSQVLYANAAVLAPAVEDYFGSSKKSHSSSSEGSNFHIVVNPEVASLSEDHQSDASISNDESTELTCGKRKKRKNSTSRRASGNFTAAAAAAAANESSSSDTEAMIVVHKPMRETLF